MHSTGTNIACLRKKFIQRSL